MPEKFQTPMEGIDVEVTASDLHIHGGEVFEEVRQGKTVLVRRFGKPYVVILPLEKFYGKGDNAKLE